MDTIETVTVLVLLFCICQVSPQLGVPSQELSESISYDPFINLEFPDSPYNLFTTRVSANPSSRLFMNPDSLNSQPYLFSNEESANYPSNNLISNKQTLNSPRLNLFTSGVTGNQAGNTPNSLFTTRVVGGTPTSINTYPIIAQLLLDSWGNQQYVQHCAGVILTARHLISTAHCFQFNQNTGKNYASPKYWRVRVGSSYRSAGGTVHTVKTIVRHPNFDQYFYTNDVAVVVVNRRFGLTSGVRQGTIAKARSEVRDGSLCTLVGWGSAESTGPQSEQLQQTSLLTINNDVCRERYNTIGAAIMDSMICAGKLDIGGSDGCYGDSGGPLIYKGVVIGLVSFGYDCGNPYFPGVYTKISHFTNWIIKTIGQNN